MLTSKKYFKACFIQLHKRHPDSKNTTYAQSALNDGTYISMIVLVLSIEPVQHIYLKTYLNSNLCELCVCVCVFQKKNSIQKYLGFKKFKDYLGCEKSRGGEVRSLLGSLDLSFVANN